MRIRCIFLSAGWGTFGRLSGGEIIATVKITVESPVTQQKHENPEYNLFGKYFVNIAIVMQNLKWKVLR